MKVNIAKQLGIQKSSCYKDVVVVERLSDMEVPLCRHCHYFRKPQEATTYYQGYFIP